MKKYKVIAFDLDDTLIDNEKDMKSAFSLVRNELNLSYTNDTLKDWLCFDREFWNEWQLGNILIPNGVTDWVEYLRSLRFYHYFQHIPIDFSKAILLNTLYCNHLGDLIEEIPGARETLETLYNRGYKLAIATNGVKKLVSKKLNHINVESLISEVACSEEIGKNKPHPLFYQTLLERCHSKKEDVLLVGDSLTSDIKGGMDYGIDTCWFNPHHLPLPREYTPTMEIDQLLKLTRKL